MNYELRMKVFFVFLLFTVYCLLFTIPVNAVVPSGVKPFPAIPFVMGDCYNKDWSAVHPEWGPVGGWWDFGQGQCGANPEDYIKNAKKITVTLDNGQKIPKPVGVGIKFTLGNIQDWANRLNKPEYDNLAFLVAVAPGLYGEVTGGSWCDSDGRCFKDVSQWALTVMEPLSKAFPNLPIYYQGTIGSLTGLCQKAATLANKNIGVKCNAWQIDPDNAQQRINDKMVGGIQGFADVYYNQISVGFEPRHGFNENEAYWMAVNALSHHPDILDIQEPNITNMAGFEKKYGFPLLKFTRDHLQKTLTDAPDLWVVLRSSLVSKVCFCGSSQDQCMSPECCYTGSNGDRVCTGPQKTNFSYWLYQLDNLPGGKTVAFYTKESSLVPAPAQNHPYGLYTTRRTDQATGNPYMYFDIDDNYQPSHSGGVKANAWEIIVTFVNQGSDKITMEYINKSGQTIKQSINKGAGLGQVGNWVDYKWTLTDADFSGNKMNGADFRINSENDGDEIVHRVIVKPVTTSPTPMPSLAASPTPIINTPFRPGWQEIDFQISTKIPANCSAITFKENGFWQTFTSYLGNLLFAPRKRRIWVKCN